MKKSKCDVVYVYKQQKNEEELRYSIRSVCKNFSHRNIYLLCDKRPRWANENLKCILENYCFTIYEKPPLNFELHRPFRYNKQLLKEVLSTDIKCAGRNSLYGAYTEGNPNTAKVSYGHDYKIYGLNDKIDITKDVVSTSNLAFMGHAGRIIKQMFPERSIYEN